MTTSLRRPLRTLLFSTLYPSSVRPSHGIFVETRLRHLLATGEVDTRVVAPVPWFPFANPVFGDWAKMAGTPAFEEHNGVQVSHPRYALPPRIGMNIAPLMLALGARASVARLIADGFDFDLIDAHYYYPDGAAAALLARWFDKPFVVTARGTDLNLIPQYVIPKRWILWTEARAAASIGVCGALMDELVSLGGDRDKAHVLRNGVDLSLFTPVAQVECRARLGLPAGRMLLSVGHLVERKGHHIAIEALTQLSDCSLAIVGAGQEEGRLIALAEALSVSDRVYFAGAQPQRELKYWYSAADALVLCSSREGWANVLLESMACSTPVVATSIWGTPEVVTSKAVGRLMAERTPESLVQSVQALFSDYPDRQEVRAYAEKFDWMATTDGQVELFDAVVRAHRNP